MQFAGKLFDFFMTSAASSVLLLRKPCNIAEYSNIRQLALSVGIFPTRSNNASTKRGFPHEIPVEGGRIHKVLSDLDPHRIDIGQVDTEDGNRARLRIRSRCMLLPTAL